MQRGVAWEIIKAHAIAQSNQSISIEQAMATGIFLAVLVLFLPQRVDPQQQQGTTLPSSTDSRVLVSQEFLDDPMPIIQPVVYSECC